MTDKVEDFKKYLSDIEAKIKSLDLEVTDWNFSIGKSEAGTTVEFKIAVLVPKKK